MTPSGTPSRLSSRVFVCIAAAVLGLVLVELTGGLIAVTRQPVLGADYQAAADYVAARHLPGQPVLIALPPPGYLALGKRDDLVFLASSLEDLRAQRYTRVTDDGRYVDFWLGVPAIVSTSQLCATLEASPDLWMIVDETRMNADWAFAGAMASAIRGSTHVAYEGEGSVTVRRPTVGSAHMALPSPCDTAPTSDEPEVGWTR